VGEREERNGVTRGDRRKEGVVWGREKIEQGRSEINMNDDTITS